MAPELLSVTGNPNATNWNLENGYNDNMGGESPLDFYPHRVLGTGPPNGLGVILTLDPEDLDYLCQGPVQGRTIERVRMELRLLIVLYIPNFHHMIKVSKLFYMRQQRSHSLRGISFAYRLNIRL